MYPFGIKVTLFGWNELFCWNLNSSLLVEKKFRIMGSENIYERNFIFLWIHFTGTLYVFEKNKVIYLTNSFEKYRIQLAGKTN